MNRRSFIKSLLGGLAAYGVVRPLLGGAPQKIGKNTAPPGPRPEPPPKPLASTGEMSNEDKKRLISELLGTEEGRAELAASMTQPIKTRRDYVQMGRETFAVEPIGNSGRPSRVWEVQ